MNQSADLWYVRLPDGRVVRAKSTEAVRRHLQSHRLPSDCSVRRGNAQTWTSLEQSAEFADLASRKPEWADPAPAKAHTGTNGSKPRSHHDLRSVGVRGLVEELQNALDSTLSRPKLLLAGLAGLLAGIALLLAQFWPSAWDLSWPPLPYVLWGLFLLLLFGLSSALVTQMTFMELSRLRPPRSGEVRARLGTNAIRILTLHVLVAGSAVLLIAGLRWLPGWALEGEGSEWLAGIAQASGLVLEVLLWPVCVLALLLTPVVVIEESGVLKSLVQWWSLIRKHLTRVVLYEVAAVALGALVTLPVAFPVLVAGWHAPADGVLGSVSWSTLCVLGGLSLSPFFAYLMVANVFIYLSLRYEFSSRPAK